MGDFPVRYDSRIVNYDRKMFIRLATDGDYIQNALGNFETLREVVVINSIKM